MIKNLVSLHPILNQLEAAFRIEAKETTEKTLEESIANLESAYNVRLKDRTVEQVELDNAGASENAMTKFQYQILEPIKSLAFLQSFSLFTGRIDISMAAVQYLGTSREVLKTAFKALQSRSQYHIGANAMDTLIYATDNIQSCSEKRLLICMFVAHKLGLQEIVSVIAQYLYSSIVMEVNNGFTNI